MTSIETLATDLDGTLIPLDDSPCYAEALRSLKLYVQEHQLQLLFISGRSWQLIRNAIEEVDLPWPDAAICDVGTSIFVASDTRTSAGATDRRDYSHSEDYADCLRNILSGWKAEDILRQIDELDTALWPQPDDCQSEFKISFFFELDQQDSVCGKVQAWIDANQAPVSIVVSRQIDGPLGLIDVLPKGVHKGFALKWWLEHHDIPLQGAVYCGDSGNDSAAMACGVNGVVVGNADQHLRSAMEAEHPDNVYFAESKATAGVLEGLIHFHQASDVRHSEVR
ncbi:HAD-IIB family hydrolase [Rhodopirellula sp. MGV]|uniref:HAD-IIB family hydrolase n=1 Tax=Rhodopirellula sp. MGV TaxID=2023130 RepID=UPI0013043EA6|nr:HAD-IIB family hydrolase [Rhodopirellula sp. MGV]